MTAARWPSRGQEVLMGGRSTGVVLRRLLVVALLVAATLVGAAVAGGPQASASTTGTLIVAAARSQAGYQANPYGSNCNKFSAYWGSGSLCTNGNRSEDWCADFAAWAWAQAGIVGLYGHGVNARASSFRTWGQANGRWHPIGDGYTPQPGDVAEYSDAHVGIYTGGPATSPTVISGNWWYPDRNTGQVYEEANTRTNGAGAALSGYISAPSVAGPTSPPDVIARRTDGLLFLYQGNGHGGWKTGTTQIGNGWNQFTAIIGVGDFTGDGTPDIIARRTDGQLFLYQGNGHGGWKTGTTQIGNGWNQFTAIIGVGDFTGDGTPDIIARRTDGQLFLYQGNGHGGWKTGTTQIGNGWNQFTAIIGVGDFTGDGTPDIIARRTDGQLFLYQGNGHGGWKTGTTQIGNGWNQFTAIIGVGDFTGDGTPDIIARRTDGQLFLYQGNGHGGWKTGTTQIGNGWNQFTAIVAAGAFAR
jgi:hypothetical protein